MRIYGDRDCTVWVVVDPQDMVFTRWLWHVNEPHPTRNGKKRYFRRSTGAGGRYRPPLYLHVEIMKRIEPPPSRKHTLVDHVDGNEWNCRRSNLRWATPAMNRANLKGSGAQLVEPMPIDCPF